MSHIVLIGTLPSSIINFRGQLVKDLVHAGCKVTALASGASEQEIIKIKSLGIDYYNYNVSRSGLNPIQDLKTLLSLYKLFKQIKPDLILAYTIKPVIWGGLAAQLAGIKKRFFLITGLGFAFQGEGFKGKLLKIIVSGLYRLGLYRAEQIIFQNPDDRIVFVDNKIVNIDKTNIVLGSGVDLVHFQPQAQVSKLRFLLIARLLKAKGIREYIAAAKSVKVKYPDAEFVLVGPEDPSPDGLSIDYIREAETAGAIIYKGGSHDVRAHLSECAIFVLPSYHEGLPRTVLEAMAMAKPIVTTNAPGCKETVIDKLNGRLVNVADSEDLALKLEWLIENKQLWPEFGQQSLQQVKNKFDVRIVNKQILQILGINSD